MRRGLIWIVGALVAGAVAWSAGWFIGRSAVTDRIATAAQELDARGWTLTIGSQSVGGFPLDYVVELTDVGLIQGDTGMLVRVPKAVIRRGEGEMLHADLPDGATIDLPQSTARVQADPSLPPVYRVRLTGEGIAMRVPEADPAARGELLATSAALTLEQEYRGHQMAADFAEARLSWEPDADAIDLTAGSIAVRSSGQTDGGPRVALTISAEQAELGYVSDAAFGAELRELLYASGAGAMELGYRMDTLMVEMDVTDDPQGMDGQYRIRSGAAEGLIGVTSGLLDIEAGTGVNTWTWQGPEQPAVTLTAAETSLRIAGPLSPTRTPQPGQLRVAVTDLTADDAFWAAFDPGTALARDPADLNVAIDGTVRLMARIDLLPPSIAPPYEISNLMIEEVALQALGATARATGDVEILQPVVVPTGQISVEASGVRAVAADLREAGLISPEMITTLNAILEVFARPGDGEDAWVTEVEMGQEGLRVNGQPLQ